MSFNGPQGQFHQDDRVNNNRGAHHYPQLDNRPLTSYTFRDFVTPNQHATIPIVGTWQSLESLDHALSPGVFARRSHASHTLSAYTPLTIALNAICAKVGLEHISERDLAQLHQSPWFPDFAKAVVKRHDVEGTLVLNSENLLSDSVLSEDHMVLLAEAFAASHNLSTIELGVVAITRKGVKAFHYPWTATCKGLTAWVVADLRTDDPVYHGLGHQIVEQQKTIDEQRVGHEEDEHNEEEEDGEDEDQEAQTTTPRKTAARVLAQQVPLPAGLSAKDILEQHTDNLQYNNILKVGLHYSNQEISKKVTEGATGSNKKISASSSGIVKRINTGIDFIEKEFEMDVGAFRTAYDTARKNNGVPIRTKDGVDDQILAANASKINDALAWVKSGGPRPVAAVAPPAPVPHGYAPTPLVPSRPVGARNIKSIPQSDGALDEPDDSFGPQPNNFMPESNNDDDLDWNSIINFDGTVNFGDTFS